MLEVCALHPRALLTESVQQHLRVGAPSTHLPMPGRRFTRLGEFLAAIALVLHDFNVDRAFWSSGPGGVGQSLVSHLIDSTFRDHHRWVDMKVYYDDHEMWKQADLLTIALIVTGQESSDTDRRMREAIFTQHISGILDEDCVVLVRMLRQEREEAIAHWSCARRRLLVYDGCHMMCKCFFFFRVCISFLDSGICLSFVITGCLSALSLEKTLREGQPIGASS